MPDMESVYQKAVKIGCRVLRNEPMANHTSFRIGGPADLLISPHTVSVVSELVRFCKEAEAPFTVIGNGSNLLVSDDGLRGVVIQIGPELSSVQVSPDGMVTCQAGLPLKKLCLAALEHSLTGLEFAYGIPGNVGGAVYMNAGAYGGEIKDVFLASKHIAPDGMPGSFDRTTIGFSYRHSAYSENRAIITKAVFQLMPGNPEKIKARMTELLCRRKEKQPLEYPSAGSTFKRPAGYYAAALIEQCGLKGASIGGAQVSVKHAGFLVNTGGATCRDVLALVEKVKQTVLEQTGVQLECEMLYLDSECMGR